MILPRPCSLISFVITGNLASITTNIPSYREKTSFPLKTPALWSAMGKWFYRCQSTIFPGCWLLEWSIFFFFFPHQPLSLKHWLLSDEQLNLVWFQLWLVTLLSLRLLSLFSPQRSVFLFSTSTAFIYTYLEHFLSHVLTWYTYKW